ncbi:hypothetical protein JW711_01195 [Candidatus Woesearchaeota archaeon]|nr:hypothetical protein [Candidatus Woesearchaeota archaeon]
MLEKIIAGIKDAERYTVRLVDEGIYNAINIPVNYLEKKGLNRKKTSQSLSITSIVSLFAMIAGEHIENARLHSNCKDSFNSYYTRYLGEGIKGMGAYVHCMVDLNMIEDSASDRDQNGAKTINKSIEFARNIRPYALLATAASAGYAIFGEEASRIFTYAGMMLPWALSLYTRDGSSTGIWQEIKESAKSLFRQPALSHATNRRTNNDYASH